MIKTGKQNPDGSTSLVIDDDARIEVGEPVRKPALVNVQFDPFEPFKKEPDKFYYRALNIRPQNLRTRTAEGFETIAGSEYGDLVLGKIPLEEHKRRVDKEEKRNKLIKKAAADRFKTEAAAANVKTFED